MQLNLNAENGNSSTLITGWPYNWTWTLIVWI